MKFHLSVRALVLAPLITFGMASASAALLVSEDFQYPDGLLSGNNGGTGFSAGWSGGSNVVASEVASYSGTGAQLTFRDLNFTVGSSGDLWLALDYTRSSGNFTGISLYIGAGEKFFVGSAGASLNVWGIGRDGSSASYSASTALATSFKTGVVHLTLGTGDTSTAELWVGSGVGSVDVSGTPDATLTGITLDGVNRIRFAGSGAFSVDNLKLGTTALDVGAVPEPSTWALLGVTLGGLAVVVRRQSVRIG